MSPQHRVVREAARPGRDRLDPAADTARTGRVLSGTGSDYDTGEADAQLATALEDGRAEVALLAAIAGARLLVPFVAAPVVADGGEPEAGSADLAVATSADKAAASASAADIAVVILTSPEGRRALPVFTSVTALQAWDPDARPSPVTSARAAQAAVVERCDVMLLDVGSEHSQVLRPSMVWALAQQREWLPAHVDPFVAQTLTRAAAGEADVLGCFGEEGDPAGAGILRVVLSLRPGLDPAQVEALATRVGERIATDGEARARIDGLAFAIRQA